MDYLGEKLAHGRQVMPVIRTRRWEKEACELEEGWEFRIEGCGGEEPGGLFSSMGALKCITVLGTHRDPRG